MLNAQVALLPIPMSVQGELVKVPVPVLANITVPVGVVGAVALVSITVAVQLVALFATTVAGWHVTVVVVVCPDPIVASSLVVR